MTLKQALIALAEGKKIRRTIDTERYYLKLDGSRVVDSFGIVHEWMFLGKNDWELYEEPKKKKVVWEWLVEGYGSHPFTSRSLLSEADAKEAWPNAKLTPLRSFEVEGEGD